MNQMYPGNAEDQYLGMLEDILENGSDCEGRNGMTRKLFSLQLRADLSKGFPALTTKKLAFKAVKGELLWFIEGSGDDNRLKEIMGGVEKTIWTANAEADYWKPNAKFDGDLGRIYGTQWRSWRAPIFVPAHPVGTEWIPDAWEVREIDQLKDVVERIQSNPNDRRLIVTAWNPGEINQMALPPCHMSFQFFVSNGRLSLHMNQRSCDMFLGVPFNIASYALLLSMVAQVCHLQPGECVITFNDAHIYHSHFQQVKEQLSRDSYPLPELHLRESVDDIDSFDMKDIKLLHYHHHPAIFAEMVA